MKKKIYLKPGDPLFVDSRKLFMDNPIWTPAIFVRWNLSKNCILIARTTATMIVRGENLQRAPQVRIGDNPKEFLVDSVYTKLDESYEYTSCSKVSRNKNS